MCCCCLQINVIVSAHTHGVFHSIQAMKLCDLICFAAIFSAATAFCCCHTYSAFGNIQCIVFVDTKNWKFIKYDNVNIENRSAHIVRILFIREKNDNNHNDCECLCLENNIFEYFNDVLIFVFALIRSSWFFFGIDCIGQMFQWMVEKKRKKN